eukprot:1151034-Pelagomonas_calceolata.AAC.8
MGPVLPRLQAHQQAAALHEHPGAPVRGPCPSASTRHGAGCAGVSDVHTGNARLGDFVCKPVAWRWAGQGTYIAGEPLVTIAAFAPQLHVISSKQRPRKLTIHGGDGAEYMFLLKVCLPNYLSLMRSALLFPHKTTSKVFVSCSLLNSFPFCAPQYSPCCPCALPHAHIHTNHKYAHMHIHTYTCVHAIICAAIIFARLSTAF